jgi:hypothetical protein
MQSPAFVISRTDDADQTVTYFDGAFFGGKETAKLYLNRQEARGEAGRLQYNTGDGTVTAKSVTMQIAELTTAS